MSSPLRPIMAASEWWRLYDLSGVDSLDARSVPCPTCGRAAGVKCIRPSGHAAWDAHAARWDAAVLAIVPADAAAAILAAPHDPPAPQSYRPSSRDDGPHQLALGVES